MHKPISHQTNQSFITTNDCMPATNNINNNNPPASHPDSTNIN